MKADLCSKEESLRSLDRGYRSDKETRDTNRTLMCPLMEKREESRLGRGGYRNSEPLTCIQLGLPPG